MKDRRSVVIVAAVIAVAVISASYPAQGAELFVSALPNSTFSPSELDIVEGDTVTWSNDGGFHNVRADDNDFRCANGCDGDGGDGDPDTNAWTFSLIFDGVGDVPYFCEIHGGVGGIGMSGVIMVGPAAIFADGFESGDTTSW